MQATFNTSGWTGDLRAFRVSGGAGAEPCPEANKPSGQLCEEPGTGYFWSLADRLDGNASKGIAPRLWTSRRVFSATVSYAADGIKTSSPITFRSSAWSSLSGGDQRALLGLTDPDDPTPQGDTLEAQAVMDFIAGKPDTDPFGFRDRESLVGDIINGAPVVVGPPSRIFNNTDYQTFARDNADRQSIAYVGANDGLLRAVRLETGEELFAYVPRPLFGKLARLAEPSYGSDPLTPHTNYVDGPIASGDAYFVGAREWRSVVVGALGAGAQAVYAIRSPNNQSEIAPDLHLWDFTDRDDPDLGYVFGKPAIVRVLTSNGPRWVAVFGNGYNSSEDDGARPAGCDDPSSNSGVTACGQAVLYVVEIETGRVIAKFRTGEGRADDPRHGDSLAKEPNGLAQPAVVGRPWIEGDGDLIATIAYAGDLFGNLWRFNLTGLSGDGTIGAEPTPVFQARGPNGAQPITAPVALAAHPTGVGTLVLFGTGRYLGLPDVSDLSVQSFYGIWDQGGAETVARSDLLAQNFLDTGIRVAVDSSDTTANTGRTSTRNTIDWSRQEGWYLYLTDEGERVVSAPRLRGDRVVFISLVVNEDVCPAGGASWVNAVSFTSGSALDESPFDFDLSGTFDGADLLPTSSGTAVAGTSLQLAAGGIYSNPASLALPGGETLNLISSSEGDLIQLLESPDLLLLRRPWRVWHQIQ